MNSETVNSLIIYLKLKAKMIHCSHSKRGNNDNTPLTGGFCPTEAGEVRLTRSPGNQEASSGRNPRKQRKC